jgi:hypothetical protein
MLASVLSSQSALRSLSSIAQRHFCTVSDSVAFMDFAGSDELDLAVGGFDRIGIYEPTYELWC